MIQTVLLAVMLGAGTDGGAAPPGADLHPPGRHLDVLGRRLWIEEEGEGPPVLLVPGGPGGSHDVFHPWLRTLARRHRVIAYDPFGRGRSARARVPSEYSFRGDVAEVEALRRALGLDRMAVLGHSYGAFVAQAYAVAHPERVTHLVLSNGMIRGADWQRANEAFNVRLAATYPDLWRKVDTLRAAGVHEGDPRLQAAYGERFAEQFALFFFYDRQKAVNVVWDEQTFNTEAYLAICGADCDFQIGPEMRAVDFRRSLPQLPAPLLVLGGRADGIVTPAILDAFRVAVPGAQVTILEKAGHLPFVEEPDRFVRRVEDFLETGPPMR
jgi:proline iminopeptidase